MTPLQTQYFRWLESYMPGITNAYKAKYGGLSAVEVQEPTFMDKIMGFANSIAQYKAQKNILKAQHKRMVAGQPPLDTSQYGMPPIRVETGVMETTRRPLMIGGGIGLIALIGILGFMALRKGR